MRESLRHIPQEIRGFRVRSSLVWCFAPVCVDNEHPLQRRVHRAAEVSAEEGDAVTSSDRNNCWERETARAR